MTRVVVLGNAGGGKSTLCRALSATLGLPHFAIDKIQWRPGWVLAPAAEFNRRHDELMSHPTWIIDGFGPWDTLERRCAAADTIVFIDHPLWVHYWWATKRQIKSIFSGRPDGPEGCPMLPVTFRLYRMMWSLHREMRPKLVDLLNRQEPAKRIVHIRSPQEMMRFLNAARQHPALGHLL